MQLKAIILIERDLCKHPVDDTDDADALPGSAKRGLIDPFEHMDQLGVLTTQLFDQLML